MVEFMRHKFDDHPAMALSITKFTVCTSPLTPTSTLKSEVESLKKSVGSVPTRIKKTEGDIAKLCKDQNSTALRFWLWKGNCVTCSSPRMGLNGLFCAKFASSRGRWERCNHAWCAKCYWPHKLDRFRVAKPADEAGYERIQKGDEE